MRFLVVSSVEEDRHNPVLLPRNASDTCAAGCIYTSMPTTLHLTAPPKTSPTALPLKRTSQPHAHSTRPSWAPTARKGTTTATQSPTVSPLFRSIVTTLSPTVSKTKQPSVSKTRAPTETFVKPMASPSRLPSVRVATTPTVHPSVDRRVYTNSKAPTVPVVTTRNTVHPSSARGMYSYTKAPTVNVIKATTTVHPSSARGVYSYANTKAPSRAICKSNVDGTYGTFSADTSTAIFIDYDYRLEAQPATTVNFITSQVLPPLEKAIVDKLIPNFFAASCGRRLIVTSLRELEDLSNKDKKNLRSAYALGEDVVIHRSSIMDRYRVLDTIMGITSSPPDLVQVARCNPLLNSTDTCVIVKGRLTIFDTSGATSSSNIQLTSTKVICDAMSNGQLAKSQSSIVSLQCINSNNTASISSSGNNPTQVEVKGGVPFYSYIIGAAAFGIVLIALFMIIRRKISQNRSKEQQAGLVAMEADNDDAADSKGDRSGNSEDDDLGSNHSMYDAHNLLITQGLPAIVITENMMERQSPDSLDEDFEITSDCDSTTAKGDGPVDAYDFDPVLCSISSPRALESFAKSSYFPKEENDAPIVRKDE